MLSDEQKRSLESAAEEYITHLDEALPYLDMRGIGKATALSRGLGLVRNPIPEHKHAQGRLSIPYITPAGIVGMTFRCIEDHDCKVIDKHSKYVKPRGQTSLLYGVSDCHEDTLDLHIAEGEIDSITLSELCGLPSVGIPGAKYWQDWWKEVLSDFHRVFIFCDGDDAGESLGHKIVKELGSRAIPIQLPQGEDVNSMYLKYGSEHLREMAK